MFFFHRASPLGEGGVALFELYGEGATAALEKLFRSRRRGLPLVGHVRTGDLLDLEGHAVDEVVIARMPSGGSWSGLDGWTLSIHGGVSIQQMLGAWLGRLGGREISLREVLEVSVQQGRRDAVEAAAYELLVGARTDRAARFFARQAGGELSAALREAVALCEKGDVDAVRRQIERLRKHGRQALRLGSPLRVQLAGRPNSGKSTLFNVLMEEERAVVTALAGTTRDLLEGVAALADYPVTFLDSAGLRAAGDLGPVEAEGIRRALQLDCDAVLYLLPPPWRKTAVDDEALERVPPDRVLVVAAMSDLAADRRDRAAPGAELAVSALGGQGIEALRKLVVARWIDDREDSQREVPCAPFTANLTNCLARCAILLGGGQGDLDAVRSALVESLRGSWPAPVEGVVEEGPHSE